MGRIRLQWSRIWEVLGNHFNRVGCSENEKVAFFAIDSLRQLSMKFIEKGEFANFRFQKDFLRPFEHIMKNNENPDVRHIIVECITHMVDSQANNIKSGWKNIFNVLRLGAAESKKSVVELSFQTSSKIVTDHYEENFHLMIDSFRDAIKCLSEFACNQKFPDTSMEAIRLIRICAKFVAEQPNKFRDFVMEATTNIEETSCSGITDENDKVWFRGWLPIMFDLSCIVTICKLDIRTRALTVMFEIIKSYGSLFQKHWWNDLFDIIFDRVFGNMKKSDLENERSEWLTTTCNHALYSVIDVFTQYYSILEPSLLDGIYSLFLWCVLQENEQLARSSTNCIENFVISCGMDFDEKTWSKTADLLIKVFRKTRPDDLLTWKPPPQFAGETKDKNSPFQYTSETQAEQANLMRKKFLSLKIKCIVQNELIQTIDNIIFFPSTSRKEDSEIMHEIEAEIGNDQAQVITVESGDLQSINPSPQFAQQEEQLGMYSYMNSDILLKLVQECLLESHRFAQTFNCNQDQRNLLWRAGFHGNSKPNLLSQESLSISCALRILFKMYASESQDETSRIIQENLLSVCKRSFEYYIRLRVDLHRDAWTPVMLQIFTKINKLPNTKVSWLMINH